MRRILLVSSSLEVRVGKAKTHVRRDGLGEMGSMLYALMLQLLCYVVVGGAGMKHETGG